MTDKYDFIIIGSGPGGCATAYKLLKQNFKVIMLEAGSDVDNDIPIKTASYAPTLTANYLNKYFWTYIQEPQLIPIANGAYYSNGRCLGGGSSINGMQYVRGSKAKYDEWYNITNDKDWSSTNIFKIHKKLENIHRANNIQINNSNGRWN